MTRISEVKYFICVGMIVLLSSCEDSGGVYKTAFEDCMAKLNESYFDYTVRVDMCKVYGKQIMYEEFNK